ncbi:MAG: HAD family phosphatase, partial [Ruminococcus sp.]|nr:HAD family phosphatase [Ruminococcus sp.]
MQIKLIALDLDGTALRSNNTLSAAVAEAIEAAAAHGVEVVAASGRPYGSMPKDVLCLRGVNYVISSNGAAIHDSSGRRIHETLLKEAAVLRLLELTKNEDLIWEAFTDGATYTDNRYLRNPLRYGCTPAYIRYVQSSRGGLDDMRQYIFENRVRLDSVEYVCPDKPKRER